MSKLTIAIACHDDQTECNLTIKSIRETAPQAEIIVVDDCSPNPLVLEDKDVRLIRNKHRCGAGASRHVGILAAQGEHVLLIDAHNRFEKGWYDKACLRLFVRSNTLHCAVCCGFTSVVPPLGTPDGTYYGADIDVTKFDGVWAKERNDDAEIPCLMGACYFVPRAWYLNHGGLQFLRTWGSEEMMLSLKMWLSGGDIRLMKNIRVWHRFRVENLPYVIPTAHIIYNKLFLIHSMLPADLVPKVIEGMKFHPSDVDFINAQNLIRADWNLVSSERMKNEVRFKKNFYWLCQKFGLEVR